MPKSFAPLLAAVVMTLAGFSLAEEGGKKEASPAQKAHRERMSTCSKDAKQQGLKGDERKAFMRQCLSDGKSANAQASETDAQRSQSAECKKEASAQGLKGKERKAFISECVGAQASAAR